jgi:hypothetical protein
MTPYQEQDLPRVSGLKELLFPHPPWADIMGRVQTLSSILPLICVLSAKSLNCSVPQSLIWKMKTKVPTS